MVVSKLLGSGWTPAGGTKERHVSPAPGPRVRCELQEFHPDPEPL